MGFSKNYAAVAITVACLMVAGCATTSEVVQIGSGNYEIAGSSATALSSGGSEKVKLLKVANQYCAGQGKQMTLVNAEDTNGHMGAFATGSAYVPGAGANFTAVQAGRRATADVVFHCD